MCKGLRKGIAQGGGKLVTPNQQVLVCARFSFMRLREGVAQEGVVKGVCDVVREKGACATGCAYVQELLPGFPQV